MPTNALIRPEVLSVNANQMVCSTLRREIVALINAVVFSRKERLRTMQNIGRCENPATLQKWRNNLRELMNQREVELADECEDGTYTNLDTSY